MSSGSDLASAQPTLAGGIIEIAALTALLGSSTAESLVLGSRGASGVLWASMSIFGTYAVIRSSFGAATPNWLRETLGVRNPAIDQSVGSALDLSLRDIDARLKLGAAIGIQSEVRKVRDSCLWPGFFGVRSLTDLPQDATGRSENEFVVRSRREVYVFDRLTARCVSSVRAGVNGTGGIYIYAADSYQKDWIRLSALTDFYGVLFSTLKALEVFALYKLGAYWLAFIAGGSWVIFLMCAICLILLGLSREECPRSAQTDVLVGQLPTPIAIGGEKAVVLGIPSYTRQSVAWTVTWILGGITSMASLILYYVVLGTQNATVFYTWSGFQFAWLIARMAFFHFSREHSDLKFTLVKRAWKELNPSYRARTRNLAYGLSTHLMNVHPRKSYCYEEDAIEIPDLGTISQEYPHHVDGPASKVEVHVTSVIGDTMLASACWVGGAAPHLTGLAVYDSCIIQCRVGEKTVSIPAARVLSGARPSVPADEEASHEALFPPRGNSTLRPDSFFWYYWVPYGPGSWLGLKSKDRQILGKRQAMLMTDKQVTDVLQSGDLFISLREVGEVKDIVKISEKACQAVMDFVA
ncbi:hypothetical protein DL765_000911 [Monosporascus sp. GIB2]|nr:hypothetical protein DL765_000911 [Monosporascus sp. GIB2]